MTTGAAPAPPRAISSLLEGLDAEQSAAVVVDAPVVAVLAGAGSGKTRVLTRRIARRLADGSAEARHVLALTFTRKAAGQLRSRLAAQAGHDRLAEGSPAVHTFHAFGGALLQRWWHDRGERPWDVARDRHRLLDAALATTGLEGLSAAALGSEIEWAKARDLTAEAYEAAPGREVDTTAVAEAWRAYEAEKQRRRVLDVDDLIALPVQLLADQASFAAERRWWHRHVFVDEAQDLNPAQFRLLTLVLGDEPDLCLVGDPNQAIYGWNGADPTLLVDVERHFPGVAIRRLTANHRCTEPIATAAAAILGVPAAPVAGDRDAGRWPPPAVSAHADETAEADAVAHRLQEARWRGGRAWSSMAVLARTRAQLDVIAAALGARDIPHQLPGSLLDRPEVLAVLKALRATDDGRRLPLRQLAADLADLADVVLAAGAPTAAEPPDQPEVTDRVTELRRAHLVALEELVGEFCQAVPTGDLDGFRSWSRGVLGARGGEHGDDRRGVTLTTFHRAKGLEWPVVVVAGCDAGLLPHRRATSAAAQAEERRLAYVAATRASEELHLTWARQRTTPWGVRAQRRSPFLDDLEGRVAPPPGAAGPGPGQLAGLRQARAALAPARRGLTLAPPPDDR